MHSPLRGAVLKSFGTEKVSSRLIWQKESFAYFTVAFVLCPRKSSSLERLGNLLDLIIALEYSFKHLCKLLQGELLPQLLYLLYALHLRQPFLQLAAGLNWYVQPGTKTLHQIFKWKKFGFFDGQSSWNFACKYLYFICIHIESKKPAVDGNPDL